MAQGAVKKSKAAAPKKPTQRVQRGARVIKPKKTSIITQNKIKHKSSSGLVGQTEKLLAQKAGHLEMLKGGKRDKKEGGDKKKSG
ncbi:ribosomal s25 [Pyrenophora seminiperda CCB06]|uniref:Ribosomal s25 n=1 Tax=Pyrenophora seminiperda CCB06 TaxID=1302712 RepID=A0A3M7M209_9PLEO|nr:ribosomal s25 [Pyrenophora seminiperda CCB06]